MAHTQGKKKLIETTPEEAQTLDVQNKDFSSTLRYARRAKGNRGQRTKKLGKQCLIKYQEIEIVERNQIEILELKSIITKTKNPLLAADWRSQKKELTGFKIVQLRLCSLRSRKEKE